MADEKNKTGEDKLVPPDPPRSFKAGEEDGYQTDTFSTNAHEGRIAWGGEELPEEPDGGPTADAEQRKARDDADSRDAQPPAADDGGLP